MFDDISTPRGRHWAVPLLAAAVLYTVMNSLREGTFALVLLAVSAVLGVWSLVNFIHHIVHALTEMRQERRLLDYKFHPNYLAETIQKMNDAQLRAIRFGRNVIELIPGERGPIEKLYGTEVYLYTAWYILKNSTQWNVYPINRFSQGTYHFDVLGSQEVDDYQQARNFHTWLHWYGYAEWGRGNTSMSWKKGYNPDKLMELLGLESDTYQDE